MRVSTNEKRKLSLLAKNSGMSVSEYLLDKAFAGQLDDTPKDSPPTYADIPNSIVREMLVRRFFHYGY